MRVLGLEEGELALAGESVTEFFEFCLHEFVSLFSASELQGCASAEGVFWLGQPSVGLGFIAKDTLGLMLNQLNVIHFRALARILALVAFKRSQR